MKDWTPLTIKCKTTNDEILGKTVKQSIPMLPSRPMPGTSTVIETMIDEKGNVHCHMENGWWVPIRLLSVV